MSPMKLSLYIKRLLCSTLVLMAAAFNTTVSAEVQDEVSQAGDEALAEIEALFAEGRYPSATTCLTCHPKQFKEWSASQHAYSQLSPVYLALSNHINNITSGTNGDFCLRCHSPVASNLGESQFISNLERHPTSREGITCVVCHRQDKNYNKVSGRIALNEGDLLQPVFGPMGDAELDRVLAEPDEYRVVSDPNENGRKIHMGAHKFSELSSPTFCGTCHDVTLFNGFRLEEAYSEYITSPAADRGVTCQDCHMGKIQGVESGYEFGPAAIVGGVPTRNRKLSSHVFAGPDFSVVHPGIFPHNGEAQEMATMQEWLQFDWEAGWGTDEWEDSDEGASYEYPARWVSIDDRYDAAALIREQRSTLEFVRQKRLEVLRNGYALDEVMLSENESGGLSFKAKVRNKTDGHNTPTGFTGERLVWVHAEVVDGEGNVIYVSGDLDPNGDLRDEESQYVHNGELPLDKDLFSLQSRFVVQNVRGGERERIVPIPYSTSALPFVRPSTLSLIFTGEPTTERNHRKGIEPLGHRWAKYDVPAEAFDGTQGPYTINVELKSSMVPANLISAILNVGFDYNLSARTVADRVAAGHEILWSKTLKVDVENPEDVAMLRK